MTRRTPKLDGGPGLAVLALLVLGASACGPEAPSDSSIFLVFDRDSDSGEYRLVKRSIETLEDLEDGRGELADLRAGGNIQIVHADPRSRSEWANSMQITDATSPELDYSVRSDGTVVPWDFHSAMMLTLYHHLEQANEYFRTLGVDRERMGKIPIFYYARRQRLLPIPVMSDNAAYAFTLDALLIPPRLILREVPFAANRGIIVHEYSHLVFNRLVYGDKRAPDYLVDNWPTGAVNRLVSLDEGIADFFAALQTEDADFISTSVSTDLYEIDRNLGIERHYTEQLESDIQTTRREEYNPYRLGTVVASTLWALRSATDLGDEQLGRTLVETLREMEGVESDLRIAGFFDTFAEQLPAGARPPACSVFRARLDAIEGALSCDR